MTETVLVLHRMREQLMKFRIMQTNALLSILYEFGIVLPSGYPALAKTWADAILIVSLQEQWARVESLAKATNGLKVRSVSVAWRS